MNTNIDNRRLHARRGVAPIIATLLLVAIAVVGGAIVFAYSQNFFSSSQISGKPNIESVKIIGYDARDTAGLFDHNAASIALTTAVSTTDNKKTADEYVTAYLKNDSVQKITLGEVRLAGTEYTYDSSGTAVAQGKFGIWGSIPTGTGLINAAAAELQPGQTATVVIHLSEDMKVGRDAQFKITTTNGAVFVGTVVIGQQSG
ncbi:MAG: archaellin/type IV pilin N-terminal domain-containing protein [Candidatus Nitrosotenuis sp.]